MSAEREPPRAFARGVVAAMAMSGMRKVTTGLGLVERTPPEQIAQEGLPGLFARIPTGLRGEAIELAHWGYGGVGGAAFGVLPRPVRRHTWAGPVYGLVSWALFEAAVAPLLGLRRAREARPVERLAIAADHVLYGIVVASTPWPHEPDGNRG